MSASPSEVMTIVDILPSDAIKVPLDVDSKEEAIDGLIDLLAERGHVTDAEDMKRVVWERENQRSTGIGEGIAIPHGKSNNVSKLVMAIGIPSEPIDFDSIDGKPVQMIALLVSPSDKIAEHIQALGRISRLMNVPSFREIACSATSEEELFAHIKTLCE